MFKRVYAAAAGLVGLAGAALGQYDTRVVAMNLSAPTGIAVRGANIIYFTEVPTPGVPGTQGGANAVKVMNLARGTVDTISMGEPEPVNLALDKSGQPFWTCRSAGVILMQDHQGNVQPFLTGLSQPTGIDVRHNGLVYFTQVPTPGVPGTMGGMNETNVSDGVSVMTLTIGEPEPYDIAVAKNGTAYWTCKSAGVILTRSPEGTVSLLLGDLNEPTGIALDEVRGHLWFTEVPSPGVPGSMGGTNTVNRIDLATNTRLVVHLGDPEPTDIAVAANGKVYWTCTSAGVIVEAAPSRDNP
jgi:streptogramin lyase